MDSIKRFFECLIPVTLCNLKCEYCYVIQENRRTMQKAQFLYSPRQIGDALSKERLGGVCYFSICGAGETLIPDETIPIVKELLEEGHYVNITTNGTLTNRFLEILEVIDSKCLMRLHFAFSFHYLELKRLNKIDDFFCNVNMMKKAGCSIMVQLNLYDGYIPYIDEIKQLCIENVGALPQIAVTRLEPSKGVISNDIKIHTSQGMHKYKEIGSTFNSPMFDFTIKNFMVKRKEFCYAGDWSGCLNLATGIMVPCYASYRSQNIFDNPESKINFCAVGNCCSVRYCVNSSHFLSLGIIPSIKSPSYAELRNRPEANWYNKTMENFLNTKLESSNLKYILFKKLYANTINRLYKMKSIKAYIKEKIPKSIKNKIKKFIR